MSRSLCRVGSARRAVFGVGRRAHKRGRHGVCVVGQIRVDIRSKVVFPSLMKIANVADLRNDFRKIAAWISDGESVTVKMRGKSFALLTPIRGEDGPPMPKVDFAGQLKRIWGDRVFSDEEIRQMKEAEQEGQEGQR